MVLRCDIAPCVSREPGWPFLWSCRYGTRRIVASGRTLLIVARFSTLFSGAVAMLVLSRRRGESIVIADNIVVTVLELTTGRVRLGIEAPKDVSVHRDEVARDIQLRGRRTESRS